MWTPEALLPPGPVKMMIIYTPPSSYCARSGNQNKIKTRLYTVIEATHHIQFQQYTHITVAVYAQVQVTYTLTTSEKL